MLDEHKEYEQYTDKPESLSSLRLSYAKLVNNLSGLERAMTIVARKFLFSEDYFEPDCDRNEAVREVLKAWCGLPFTEPKKMTDEGKNEFVKIKNWFRRYVEILKKGCNENQREKLEKMLDELKEKEKKFSYDVFTSKVAASSEQGDNTYKSISYDMILAAAWNQGALKEWIGVAEVEFPKKVYKYSEIKQTYSFIKKNDLDLVARMVYAYLINRKQAGRSEDNYDFEAWVITDVANWKKGAPKIETSGKKGIQNFFFSEEDGYEPLFETKLVGGNISKLRVNPKFIKKYGIHIEEKNKDIKTQRNNCTVYYDQGSGCDFQIKT